MSNCDRFLDAYAKIERHLRRVLGASRSESFAALIDRAASANRAVARFRVDLKEYGDLRNAIVHERTDGHPIADPRDDVVVALERIASVLTDPPKVLPLFSAEVIGFSAEASIGEAVRVMYEHDLSQVPIQRDGETVGLLTTDTIARWVGALAREEMFDVSETLVGSVLGFAETTENYAFLGRRATVFDVLERFGVAEALGTRLEALLVTETGDSKQAVLGIITVADLPRAYAEIERAKDPDAG